MADNNSFDENQLFGSEAYHDPKRPTYSTLHWNTNPQESLSDWTIVISSLVNNNSSNSQNDDDADVVDIESNSSRISETYHVHKCMLGAGAKQCGYFRRLFMQDNYFEESKTATSRIELGEMAAKAFPAFLDYLYSPEHKANLTTENATALYYFGMYFECESLCWEVTQFLEKDMSLSNCHVYYENASILMTDRIRLAISQFCKENILKITTDSPLIKVSDATLWLAAVPPSQSSSLSSWTSVIQSRHMSCLIAAFLESHEVNYECFLMLTGERRLPVIDFQASQKLIEIERKVLDSIHTNLATMVSSLQERCVTAMAKHWQEIDTKDDAKAFFFKLSPHLLTNLLFQSLATAKNDLVSLLDRQEKERQNSKKLEPTGITVSGGPGASNGYYQRVGSGSEIYYEKFVGPAGTIKKHGGEWWLENSDSSCVYAGGCCNGFLRDFPNLPPAEVRLRRGSYEFASYPCIKLEFSFVE